MQTTDKLADIMSILPHIKSEHQRSSKTYLEIEKAVALEITARFQDSSEIQNDFKYF